MKHKTTQTDWERNMCEKILPLLRDSLYLDFRYFDTALQALTWKADPRLASFATDGIYLYYSSEQLLRLYPENPLFLQRAYLHSVLHCIFRHLWLRQGREERLWNLSCDIAVEWMIDSLKKPSVNRILSGLRSQLYQELSQKEIPVTAANIYRMLLTFTDEEKNRLLMEFFVDDHRFWPKEENPSAAQKKAGDMWDKLSRRADREMSTRGEEDGEGSALLHTQIKAGRPQRTYTDFLRKFTVLREEMHIDQDSFDPGYYTYGLRLYRNMPLIEHPESREASKILTFVIVLDTSYSTSGDLVKQFLYRTFDIIRKRDSFFRNSQIHIIQADSQIQAHEILKNKEDIDRILAGFDLKGGGSTDFRPAFSFISKMVEDGKLHDLKGVLYFTDGKGIYPARAPSYQTAFVFIGEETPDNVPSWAMKIHLSEEELYEHQKSKRRY